MSKQEISQAMRHSLVLYLREDAFPSRGWTANVTSELLQPYQNIETGQFELGKFQAQYQNWVYYSIGVSGVTVPAQITASPTQTQSYINYPRGMVAFTQQPYPTTVTATYSYYIVNVIDGFPDLDNIESLQLPAVSVDLGPIRRNPLQIGGGFFVNRTFDLDVFARNDSERDQIVEVLDNALSYNFQILDFELADYPLNFNGDRKSTYSKSIGSTSGVVATAYVKEFSVQPIRIADAIKKMQHRALVTIDVQVTR